MSKVVKLAVFFLMSLLLVSMASAWCYDNSNSYNDVDAYAEVCGTLPECDGTDHGWTCVNPPSCTSYAYVCIGDWYADISHRGSDFYYAFQADSWDDYTSSRNGVSGSGLRSATDGKLYLPLDGTRLQRYIIYAFDYEESNAYEWVWTSKGGGYVGDYFTHAEYYSLDCYNDGDCSNSEYCDISASNINDWYCKEKECDAGDIQCDNQKQLYICLTGSGEQRYSYELQGIKVGFCGVECTSDDSYCNRKDSFVGDSYCINRSTVGRDFVDYSCETPQYDNVFIGADSDYYTCVNDTVERPIEVCGEDYYCDGGSCVAVEPTFFERLFAWFRGLFN